MSQDAERVVRSQRIDRQVMSWSGVTSHPHRFGGTEYRLGRREVGHIHGETLVDVPLPRRLRDELVARGLAQPHHVLPESGWVSVAMRTAKDVEAAVRILRQSYEIACRQRDLRRGRSSAAVPEK
jgi:hypothetical protein